MTPHPKGVGSLGPAVVMTARPAKDGALVLDGVAAGKYLLKVFFKGQVIARQPVEIVEEKPLEVEIEVVAPESVDNPAKAVKTGENAGNSGAAKPDDKKADKNSGAAKPGDKAKPAPKKNVKAKGGK
jgi:hypothetical protein